MKRGAALPMMLLVISMTSALAVGGAFVARQMAANARALERGGALEPLAEAALVGAVVRWDSLGRAAQTVGSTVALPSAVDELARADVWVTRLTPVVYWVVAEARGISRPRLSRRLGVVVRVVDGSPRVVSERGWSELP